MHIPPPGMARNPGPHFPQGVNEYACDLEEPGPLKQAAQQRGRDNQGARRGDPFEDEGHGALALVDDKKLLPEGFCVARDYAASLANRGQKPVRYQLVRHNSIIFCRIIQE